MTCPRCGTLNPAGMRYCGMCGRALDVAVGGRERRRVSTVFVDLAAFSDLTRDQDPEELRDLADEVLTVVASVIEEYDGYVDAFRGDGLIALFGAPHSHPDDPERAVRAAASSLGAIERIGASRGIALRGRAGVNTGVVIAGAIGSGRVRDYTVMGSAVNLAARLEAAARPGEVWVGPETFRAVRHRLAFEAIDGLSIDGFPDVRRAYRFLAGEDARANDPYAGLAFVGRDEELRALRAARDAVVAERRAREMWVAGEAGSGKSRLIREAFPVPGDALPPDPDPGDATPVRQRDTVLWLRVPVDGELPWPRLAAAVFGVDEAAQSPSSRQRIERELTELLPGEPRWWRAILASLDLVEQRPWRRLDRRGTDRTALAWSDLLAARARAGDGAWVLVVDDDPHHPDLDAFLALVTRSDAPILVVRAGRVRDVPARVRPLRLAPLSPEASMELVRQLVEAPMEAAARTLAQQVGGVPSHLIELGRALSLQEDGAVSLSLAGLLQARLDRVSAPARMLLAHASLAGERVWDGLLRELASGRRGGPIEALVQDKLLVPEPGSSLPGQREYRFQSELLRRAVMRMVPFAERPPVHVRIASWLEAHAPLAFSEAIAEQFAAGGAQEAAYAHVMAAAEFEQRQGDAARSDGLFQRAAELDVSSQLRAQAALAWAQAALDRGDAAALRTALGRAAPWIEGCDDEACVRLRGVREGLTSELAGLEAAVAAAADDPVAGSGTAGNGVDADGNDGGDGGADPTVEDAEVASHEA